MSKCAFPTQPVTQSKEHTTTRNFDAQNVYFYHFKPYAHHKNVIRIQIYLDWRVLMKRRPIKSEPWIRLSKLPSYFSSKNSDFLTVFNGCCYLLQRLKCLNTSSIVYSMHYGKDLIHLLDSYIEKTKSSAQFVLS